VTREVLATCFHLPSEQACRQLGIGLTVLKRQCRRYGIARWPFRKMKSLDRLITNVQAGLQPSESEKVRLKSVEELEAQKAAMAACQVLTLDDSTKRLQQAYSKASHKRRVQLGEPIRSRPRSNSRRWDYKGVEILDEAAGGEDDGWDDEEEEEGEEEEEEMEEGEGDPTKRKRKLPARYQEAVGPKRLKRALGEEARLPRASGHASGAGTSGAPAAGLGSLLAAMVEANNRQPAGAAPPRPAPPQSGVSVSQRSAVAAAVSMHAAAVMAALAAELGQEAADALRPRMNEETGRLQSTLATLLA